MINCYRFKTVWNQYLVMKRYFSLWQGPLLRNVNLRLVYVSRLKEIRSLDLIGKLFQSWLSLTWVLLLVWDPRHWNFFSRFFSFFDRVPLPAISFTISAFYLLRLKLAKVRYYRFSTVWSQYLDFLLLVCTYFIYHFVSIFCCIVLLLIWSSFFSWLLKCFFLYFFSLLVNFVFYFT